mmetsp:Transcript_1730/g.3322  ORF Transcript_1730/g.3322 Transcript_1730/m.3322 type:complete len:206 (+) Transcript_1730:11186-11803(+)
MDRLSGILDSGKAGGPEGLGHALHLVLLDGLGFPLHERSVPLVHERFDVREVVLHGLEDFVNVRDLDHRISYEFVNTLGAPVEVRDSSLNDSIELCKVRGDERLLDRKELVKDAVVHVDNEIQVSSPCAEDLNRLVNFKSRLGHRQSEEKEVLDFAKKADKRGIEVRRNETCVWVAVDEGELELGIGRCLNVATPLFNLLCLVFL